MENKTKRKVFAATASAALVASAVVPAATFAETKFTDIGNLPADEQAAINALVDAGVINGKGAGIFDPYSNMKRGEVAAMIARYKGLDIENAKDAGFNDVKGHWAEKYINAAAEAGILQGKGDGVFDPEAQMKRAEYAELIVKTFGLELVEGVENNFKDIKGHWGEESIKILYSNGLIKGKDAAGTIFDPEAPIQRNHVALLTYNTIQYADAELKVESVSAINPTTLKVEGEGLKKLKAEDITVEGNTVTAVTPTADGKSATVTLGTALTLDKDYKVTVKVDDQVKDFTVKFSYTVTSVTLDEKTYDDDTVGQKLTFKVNGESATADTEWLRQAGYTVNFVAVDNSTGAAATTFFKGGPDTSSTGLLDDKVPVGKYTVEVQIIKDGKVVVSDKATITIADLESTVSAIDSVEFTTAGGIKLNSTTLVTGESADITKIIGDAAGKSDVDLPIASAEVTSSNPAVISVSGQTLTANVAGTATITVKIGNVTKTINMTVSSVDRKVTKVTPSESTVKVVLGQTRTIQVTAVDQYGDPIAVANTDVVEDLPKDATSTPLVTITSDSGHLVTGTNGKTATGFAIKGDVKGNGTILFKDADNKVVGQIAVQVTDVDNVGSTKIEYTVASNGTTNTFGTGPSNARVYQVSKYNTAGFFNGVETVNDTGVAAGELYVYAADPTVADVTADASGNFFTVEGKKAGSTDIVLKDENGQVKHKFTVTITAQKVAITKVNFKATATIDYIGKAVSVNDVLDVRTDGAFDPIVYGVEHNDASLAKVRLDDSNPAELVLYIDKNNDGTNNAGDVVLGAVTAEVLTGATGTNIGALAGTNIDLTGVGVYTTASKDKGTILFRVIVDANDDGTYAKSEAVATTVLNVDVK